jgi:hypothetical protein
MNLVKREIAWESIPLMLKLQLKPTITSSIVVPKNLDPIEREISLDNRFYQDWHHTVVVKRNMKEAERNYIESQEFFIKLQGTASEDIFCKGFPSEYLTLPPTFKITCTVSMIEAEAWIDHYIFRSKCKAVGIDTEFDYITYSDQGESIHKQVLPHLISIATKEACLIIQTQHIDVNVEPSKLITLLSDSSICKVFYGLDGDLDKIVNWFKQRYTAHESVSAFISLSSKQRKQLGYDNLESLPGKGLKGTCRCILGVELRKDVETTFSRWSRVTLSDKQIEYATEDAYCTLLIYHTWIDRKRKLETDLGNVILQ